MAAHYQHCQDYYKRCLLCPRSCGVDRQAGKKGFCRESSTLRLACAVLYGGEEPPLLGKNGSGTIFVSGCNLGCVFCQTWQASQGERLTGAAPVPLGKAVSIEKLVEICLALQKKGAQNINFVTGSHAVPAITEGIAAARKAGLQIPIVWNSSGYEGPQSLEMLKNYVDIYMPDLKTLDSGLAARFFNAPDYPQAAADAILKMIDTCGGLRDKVIIRHLILPGFLESTRQVLYWFAENAKGRALISVMSQYTPLKEKSREKMSKKAPRRYLEKKEYETVLGWLEEYSIEEGFCQEFTTDTHWLPDFNKANPFPPKLSVPVWHFNFQDDAPGDSAFAKIDSRDEC